MSKIKIQCSSCGYVIQEGDGLKCPICGGIMTPTGEDKACDKREEDRWNNGYHNDFEEGRKTGSYCDPRLEKYTNGGDHYHSNLFKDISNNTYVRQTTTQQREITVNSPLLKNSGKTITLPNSNGKGAKIAMFIVGCLLGMMLNILSLFLIIPLKAHFKNKPDEESRKAHYFIVGIRVGAILCILYYIGMAILGATLSYY